MLLVTIASCIACYLSFGFRNFAKFCLIAVPILVLPAARLGYRFPVAKAASSAVIMGLFFGSQILQLRPPFTRSLHNGMQFSKFLSVTVLLTMTAALSYTSGTSHYRPLRANH
jgi:hypothetical protein